jgi:hypothetical protein
MNKIDRAVTAALLKDFGKDDFVDDRFPTEYFRVYAAKVTARVRGMSEAEKLDVLKAEEQRADNNLIYFPKSRPAA